MVYSCRAPPITIFAFLIFALTRHLAVELTRPSILMPGLIVGYLAGHMLAGNQQWRKQDEQERGLTSASPSARLVPAVMAWRRRLAGCRKIPALGSVEY